MTSSPILSYSVAPSSADITPAGGPASTIGSLQITIANNNTSGTTYTVDSIVFQIPVGADTTDLIPSADVSSITTTAWTGWSLGYQGTSDGFASWLLEPTASGVLVDGTGTHATLNKVTVNGAAGAAQIWVIETIDGCTGQPCTPPGLIIDKVQPQPELLAFSVNQALVLVGQQPVLSWHSQGVTQCTLECSDPGEELTVPANSPAGGYRAPAVTAIGGATYVLTGYANGTVLAQTLGTSVQVIELKITSFTATPGAAGTLTLAWTTEHATGVTLTLTGGIGTTPPVAVLGTGPANCSGATLSGLSPAWAGTLTLTASNKAAKATVTKSVGISDSACPPPVSTPDNGLFDNNRGPASTNLCLSRDGTELVGWVFQEIKDDGRLSQIQAAVSSDWGSTWTFTDMTASNLDAPFQVTSNSSAYYGLLTPISFQDNWNFSIANATTPTGWQVSDTSGIPNKLELFFGSLFAFQNQVWLRMISQSAVDRQTVIFRLGSENEWAEMSSFSGEGNIGVVNGVIMVATASMLASSIDGKTWTVERDGLPWVGTYRTPIAPPVSSNGCLWLVTCATDGTGTLYCRDPAGVWHTFPFTSPPSYSGAGNCFAVVGGGSLQIYPPGGYNTPLELTLTSKPILTLPHS